MTSNPIDLKRRNFLLSAGVGGASAVAAVAGGAALLQPETAAPIAAHSKAQPTADSGYQATEHVRNYYRTARV